MQLQQLPVVLHGKLHPLLPAAAMGEHLLKRAIGGQLPFSFRNIYNTAWKLFLAEKTLDGQCQALVQPNVPGRETTGLNGGILPVSCRSAAEHKGPALQKCLQRRNAAVKLQCSQNGEGTGQRDTGALQTSTGGLCVAVLEKGAHELVQAVLAQDRSCPDAGKVGIASDVDAQIPGVSQACS